MCVCVWVEARQCHREIGNVSVPCTHTKKVTYTIRLEILLPNPVLSLFNKHTHSHPARTTTAAALPPFVSVGLGRKQGEEVGWGKGWRGAPLRSCRLFRSGGRRWRTMKRRCCTFVGYVGTEGLLVCDGLGWWGLTRMHASYIHPTDLIFLHSSSYELPHAPHSSSLIHTWLLSYPPPPSPPPRPCSPIPPCGPKGSYSPPDDDGWGGGGGGGCCCCCWACWAAAESVETVLCVRVVCECMNVLGGGGEVGWLVFGQQQLACASIKPPLCIYTSASIPSCWIRAGLLRSGPVDDEDDCGCGGWGR